MALGAVAICTFLILPGYRFAMLTLGPLLPMIALAVLPAEIVARLTSFSGAESGEKSGAAQSTDSRIHMLQRSLVCTIWHPALGVGPGQFSVWENEVSKEEGARRGFWHQTHNVYTQVSSEVGIPALLFMLGAIAATFGILKRIRRAARAVKHTEVWMAAVFLTIALVGFCVSTFFLSFARHMHWPAIFGFVGAFGMLAERALAAPDRPAPVPASMPRWRPPVQRPETYRGR